MTTRSKPLGALLLLISLAVQAGPLDGVRSDMLAGRWHAAEVALKGLLQVDPKNAEARYLLGALELMRGNGAAAEHELKDALALGFPPDRVLGRLGMALLYQGRADLVLKEIQAPPGADSALAADVLAVRGMALAMKGDGAGAERALGESLAQNPAGQRARLGRARLAAGQGEADDARRWLLEVTGSDPAAREAWELLAQVEVKAGRPKEAVAALDRALELSPESLPLRLLRAQLRLDRGDADGAEVDLNRLTELAPGLPALGLLKGRVALVRGRLEEGVESLSVYLGAQPKDPLALYLAAAGNWALGQQGRALGLAERLKAVAPAHPQGLALLATIRLARGDQAGAEAELAAIPAGQEPPAAVAVRLRLALAQGRLDEALAILDRRIAAAEDPWEDRLLRLRVLAVRRDWTSVNKEAAALAALRPERSEPAALLVESLLAQGDAEGALVQARARVQASPQDAEARMVLGVVLGRGGDKEGARAAFRQALELDPKNAAATANLARLEAASGDLSAARESLDRLVAAAPESTGAILGLARLDLQEGRAEDARNRLAESVARSPQDLGLRRNLAAVLGAQGDYVGALRVLQEAPAEQAEAPVLLAARGELELAAGQPAAATATFESLVKRLPKSADARLLLLRARAESGQLAGLEALTQQALALGDSSLVPTVIGSVYKRLPDAAARGRFLEAVRQAIPEHPVYRALAAELALERQDGPRAIEHLQAARRSAPDSAQVFNRLAALLVSEGRIEDSVRLHLDWLSRHPQDQDARSSLAGMELQQGRVSKAVGLYREVLQASPERFDVLNNLAMLTLDQDPDQALALAERAAALAPSDWRVGDTLAIVLLRKGRAADAVGIVAPLHQAEPGNPTLAYRLAEALERTGEGQKALGLLLEIGDRPFPERAQAQALIARLKAGQGPR